MLNVFVDDELIGRNVLRLRGDRSQKDVADAMREFGYPWSQTTVWKVEQGTRSLRLHEADALARVLGSTRASLTMSSREAELDDANSKVARAHRSLDAAIETYIDALDELDMVLKTQPAGTGPVETSRDWLKHTPSSVVADVEQRRQLTDVADMGLAFSNLRAVSLDGKRHEETER
ncbi:hypothetical protein ABID92_000453 [Frigoribacterium sp. PvP120]|uniref:helix-turn-helix domain-containing protein n=1 Tax=unclassified Frigoribacterium TaxID=2627005 RepID=UPI001AE5207C|nr:helix-turn-helix transcriptional regulator [Frigoribacterium sp. PvP121]MBP1241719.1 hypothetical protein [Frigoribacterium sp. PvP121]